MSERRKFTDYEKKTIYAKHNGKCAICGKPVSFSSMTVDHKIPLSQGGTNFMDNLQLSCLTCNLMKSGLSESEFYDRIKIVLSHHRFERLKEILIGGKVV